MLSTLSKTLHKYAKGWLILILLLLDGAFIGFILPRTESQIKEISGGIGPIDLQFFYTPEKVYGMVAAYGDTGRALYRNVELTLDILYPIVYTLFFSLVITWLFQHSFALGNKMQMLNVVPFGAWLFDLLENLGIVAMLSVYPATPTPLAWVTAIFTLIKWTFAGASIVLLLVGIIAVVGKALKR